MNKGKLRSPRPRWSAKSSFLAAVGILGVVTPLVLLVVHKSIWTDLEVITAAVAGIMFAFLTAVLHAGVRFDKSERFSIAWPKTNSLDVMDAMSFMPGGCSMTILGASEV